MTALLLVGVAAAVAAYVLAYLTPTGASFLSALIVGGLCILTLPTRAIRWEGRAARFVPAIRKVLVVLLVATGGLTVLSRQVWVMPDRLAERFGFVLGDLLAVLALVFFHGRRHWPVSSSLLPACVGLLVLASLNIHAWGFLPLAALAGVAFWTWAITSGGPRRRGLALLLFVLAGAGLAAGTTTLLPWAQPHVTRFVAKAYTEGRTGLSDRSELGEIEKLAPSQRRVARVWTHEPLRRPLLLRMKVYDHFDGRRWAGGASALRTVVPGPEAAPLGPVLAQVPGSTFNLGDEPGGGRIEARVLPALGFDDGWGLLLPVAPARVRLPGQSIKVSALGEVFAADGLPPLYGAAADAEARSGNPGRNDLQLPPLADDLGPLAATLGASDAPPSEKLARTVEFLHARPFRYTLEVGAFRTRTPVNEFLLEKKAGYCEYFASAAAILLRLQGVPTRYVKGVSVRPESAVGGHYRIRESDAHSWIEAWIPGRGWVEADPTPPGDYAELHASPAPGPLEEAWETLQARVSSVWARVRQEVVPQVRQAIGWALAEAVEVLRRRPAVVFIGVLLLLFTLALPRLAVRVRRWALARQARRRTDAARAFVPAELCARVAMVERLWTRAGWPRPHSRGLQEHLRAIPSAVLDTDARALSETVVDAYYRAAFGGTPIPAPRDRPVPGRAS